MGLPRRIARNFQKTSTVDIFYPHEFKDDLNTVEQLEVSVIGSKVLDAMKMIAAKRGMKVESENYSCYYTGRNKKEVTLKCEWQIQAYDEHSSLLTGHQQEQDRECEIRDSILQDIVEYLSHLLHGCPNIKVVYKRTGVDDDLVELKVSLDLVTVLAS